MINLKEIRDSLINGDSDAVVTMVKEALDEGQDAHRMLEEGLIAGISIVGDKYESGEFFLPEMVIAATAMKEGLKVLRPLLLQSGVKAGGTVILGTVTGDIHSIGKSIVGTMMEGAGFVVIDIGVDVGPERFVEAAKEHDADLVAVSAILTTTMRHMEGVVKAVKEAGLKAKVMVGGACLTQEFADEIGADAFAPNAPIAVRKAKELMKDVLDNT